MPYPIVIMIVFVIGYFIYLAVKNQKTKEPPQKQKTNTASTPPAETKKNGGGSAWKKFGKVLLWIAVIVAILCIAGFEWKRYEAMQKYKAEARQMKAELAKSGTVVPKEKYWTLQWQLPEGVYVRGLNKSGPLPAKVERRPNGDLWITVYYRADGKPVSGKMRLELIDTGFWKGSWGQDIPADFGGCELHEKSPRSTPGYMSGYMTGLAEVPAFLELWEPEG